MDLVVPGFSDGQIRLWQARLQGRTLTPVTSIPLEGFVCFDATVRFLLGQEHRLEARHGQRKKRALGDDAFDWSGGKGESNEPSEQASDASEEQKECGSNQMLVMTHRPSHYASTLLRP
ncbi:hypothetical protein KRP22_006240 [Phytophthora ramorum]|nr:hypothetical protein KRP22_2627 [Phytophthora ramorum]